eukprot:scaffold429_cov269-Pinguiococcus_pyrenoidosus.AAC.30
MSMKLKALSKHFAEQRGTDGQGGGTFLVSHRFGVWRLFLSAERSAGECSTVQNSTPSFEMALAASMNSLRRVCIVGSGPSGFYAAKYLLRVAPAAHVSHLSLPCGLVHQLASSDAPLNAKVHMLDRLVTPFGLVRSGVAPDHPEVKAVQNDFTDVVHANRERFRFFGNVEVGKDVQLPQLEGSYDAVICAYGAGDDATMGIPGEQGDGVLSARAFVNWYNGHPEYSWIGDKVDQALQRSNKVLHDCCGTHDLHAFGGRGGGNEDRKGGAGGAKGLAELTIHIFRLLLLGTGMSHSIVHGFCAR